jgi:hypothetical protein
MYLGNAPDKSALAFEGAYVGWLTSAAGGTARANVDADQNSLDLFVRKRVSSIGYENILIGCGTGMSTSFYEWIATMMTAGFSRKSGVLDTVAHSNQIVSRLGFSNALVTSLASPALDVTSKDPAELTVTITPEATERQAAPPTGVFLPASQNACMKANFRLQIEGLDCSKVRTVGPIQVYRVAESSGERAVPKLGVSNIELTFAESSAKGFYDWFEDFAIRGHNGRENLKSGTIQLLSRDLQQTFFTFELRNLGILEVSLERPGQVEDHIGLLRALLYFEQIKFSYFDPSLAG